jgi:amino acid permease
MTENLEYDWPPTIRYHRRRRHAEILPHVDVTIRHHRQPSWIVPAVIIVAVLVLWRSKLGLLMLAALTGWPTIAAALILVVILALVHWRERRAGRKF